MINGDHIGKIILKIRDEERRDIRLCLPKKMNVQAISRTNCHPKMTYLITGGLGGFGLELAKWLFTRGASKFDEISI